MMENKAPQALDVTVKNYEGVADLSPVGTFVFCILCFAFWAVDLGFLGDGATTAIGFLGLAVFVPYLVAGVALSRRGPTYSSARCLGHAAVCSTRLMPCSQGPGFPLTTLWWASPSPWQASIWRACSRRSACRLASCPPYIVLAGQSPFIDYTGAIPE